MNPTLTILQRLRNWVKRGDKTLVVDLVKARPQLIQQVDAHGKTLLHYAAQYGQEPMVKLLIKLGALPNAQAQSPSPEHPAALFQPVDHVGQTALHFASAPGNIGVVKLLLGTEGIDVERRDENGRTAFLVAAMKGRRNVVEELMKARAFTNVRDSQGRGALHLAVIYEHDDLLAFLLNHPDTKLSINWGDNFGNTALHYGMMCDHAKIVKMLLTRPNLDVNARNSRQQTPLLVGLVENDLSDVKCTLMEDNRIDLNAVDYSGKSALHIAVRSLNTPVVKVLAPRRDVNIAIMDYELRTPLEAWVSLKPVIRAFGLEEWTEIKQTFWQRYLQDGNLTGFMEIWTRMCFRWMKEDGIVPRTELRWLCIETKQTLDGTLSRIEHICKTEIEISDVERLVLERDDKEDAKDESNLTESEDTGTTKTGPSVSETMLQTEGIIDSKTFKPFVATSYSLPFEILQKIFIYLIQDQPRRLPGKFITNKAREAFFEAGKQCFRECWLELSELQRSCPFEVSIQQDDFRSGEDDSVLDESESLEEAWLLNSHYSSHVSMDSFYEQYINNIGHDDSSDNGTELGIEGSINEGSGESESGIGSPEPSTWDDEDDGMPKDQKRLDEYFEWARMIPKRIDGILYYQKVVQKYSM